MATRTNAAERRTTQPAPAEQPATALATSAENREIRFKPLAESEEITLTIAMIMNTIAVPTRNGARPTVRDCINFAMLCKARQLNPFVGDAFLIGYDSKDGPTFTLITAIQSLRKRAEANPNFDGCRRGIIVKTKAGEIEEREGSFRFDDEILVGGWAECFRKDHKTTYRETVKLATYNQNRSRWSIDPEGMISKIGEAAALRRAFPSDVAGLYLAEEFADDRDRERKPIANGNAAGGGANTAAKLAELASRSEPGAAPDHRRKMPASPAHPENPSAESAGSPAQNAGITITDAPDPEPADATPDNPVKRGDYERQLSKAMQVSDLEAVMLLAKNDKELSDADYEALDEHAGKIEANIRAANEGAI